MRSAHDGGMPTDMPKETEVQEKGVFPGLPKKEIKKTPVGASVPTRESPPTAVARVDSAAALVVASRSALKKAQAHAKTAHFPISPKVRKSMTSYR